MTIELPAPEIDRSSSIPSTVFTSSSMISVIAASVSSGDAPGRLVRTLTVGRSTDGSRSTPRLKYPAAPTTHIERMSIAAKIGRWIHTSASFRMASSREQTASAVSQTFTPAFSG